MKNVFPLLLFFIATSALAEEPPSNAPIALTLTQAQEIALKQHPEILSADARVKASEEAVKEVRSNYFPQSSANAVRAFADDGTRLAAAGGINNPTVFDRGSVGINISQLITDFGRTSHQVAAAKAQANAQAARSLSVRDQVLFEVTSDYYNVLRAQKIVQVAQATQKARDSLMEQVTSLRDAKMKSNLDVSIAAQNVSIADLLALRAQNELDNAEAQFSEAMGYGSQQHFILQDDAKATPGEETLDALLQEAKEQNPELQSLRAQLNAARQQAEAEQAAHYPTVSALGFAGENPIRDNNQLSSDYAAAGVTLNIPLFTGGRLTAAAHRAQYQAHALELDVMDKENQIARDVRVSWNNLQTAFKNISVSEALLKTGNESLELTQARYDIGKSSIVDLAQAQLSQTQAQIENANAIYEYLIQRALLAYKTGVAALHTN